MTDFNRAASSHVFTYPIHARVSILSASIHVLVAEARYERGKDKRDLVRPNGMD